ncbi:MAG TPA: hypothetical protein VNL16_16125 [Chloroflexota bacterium]|nr:hypothetical protein [Chloroflexota bacterium]
MTPGVIDFVDREIADAGQQPEVSAGAEMRQRREHHHGMGAEVVREPATEDPGGDEQSDAELVGWELVCRRPAVVQRRNIAAADKLPPYQLRALGRACAQCFRKPL